MRLNQRDHELLQLTARMMFATPRQLERWGTPQYAVSRTVARLEAAGLVDVMRDRTPNVISITYKGALAAERPLPSGKRHTSWRVVAHRCHRNEAELLLREHYPRFTFWSRRRAYALGLNPAIAEHGADCEDGRRYLVLLDDYLMEPSRIAHCWTRPNAPNPRYFHETRSQYWRDHVDRLIVVSTDERQTARHRVFLAKCADVRRMDEEGVKRAEIRERARLNNLETITRYLALPQDVQLLTINALWGIE